MEVRFLIQIGLCGWDSRSLYEPGIKGRDKLEIYSNIYSTVEVNSTFYNIPTLKTVEQWFLTTPADFRFSIKMNRLFSHDSRLTLTAEVKEQLTRFVNHTSQLKEKLSWYLLQLPPSFTADPIILDEFLTFLRATIKTASIHCGIAVEFRHSSWYHPFALDILQTHQASQVISSSFQKWPCSWVKQAQTNYIRLHGLHQMYRSAYSESELKKLFHWIIESEADQSWVYFDNTATSSAKENSQYLMTLFGQTVPDQTTQLDMNLPIN